MIDIQEPQNPLCNDLPILAVDEMVSKSGLYLAQDMLNDPHYAQTYARSKWNQSKWSPSKISFVSLLLIHSVSELLRCFPDFLMHMQKW